MAKISQKYLNLKEDASSGSNSSLPEVNLNLINQDILLEAENQDNQSRDNESRDNISQNSVEIQEFCVNSAINRESSEVIDIPDDYIEKIEKPEVEDRTIEPEVEPEPDVEFNPGQRISAFEKCEFLSGMKNNEWELKFR